MSGKGCFEQIDKVKFEINKVLEGEGDIKQETELCSGEVKPGYNKGALIYNWYEDRIDLPEIKSDKNLWSTEQKDSYQQRCPCYTGDEYDFAEKLKGVGSKAMVGNYGGNYYNNYSTTTDLLYNHLKKGLCGSIPRKYHKGLNKFEPDTFDLLKNYGNTYDEGKVKRRFVVKDTSPDTRIISEYQAQYSSFTTDEYINNNNLRKGRKTYKEQNLCTQKLLDLLKN